VGRHHPERFFSRAQRIGRPYTRLLIGEAPVRLRVSPFYFPAWPSSIGTCFVNRLRPGQHR
jgi:hypothetical protein